MSGFQISHRIPPSWSWSTIGLACLKVQDGTHFSPQNQLAHGAYRYITAKNVRPSGLDLSNVSYLAEDEHRVIYKRCDPKKGDVLLVKDGVNTGDAAVNTLDEEISLLSSVCLLRPNPELLSSQFLRYFLLSPIGYQMLTGQMTGTAIKRIVLRRIKDSPVPIAPLAEQESIVAEIEKQFSRLDEAVANLKRVKANLKRYKAAVLKAAVEGKLTEAWRKQHPNVEPASKLLERILAERRAHWEKNELSKMKARDASRKHESWKKRYKEAERPKPGEIYEIPKSWVWTNLGELSWSVKDGPHYSPKYSEIGIPFISGGNIRPEGIDFSTAKFISPELHRELSERCKPEYGDLLYTKGGTTGIARVNTERREFCVWVHVAVMKLVDSIKRFYLQYALNSPHCYRQSQKYTHGVGNQDLGLTRMIWITVPLPPLQEQEQIVAEVERRLSVIDELEATVEANLTRAERLRQSILSQAFSGRPMREGRWSSPDDVPAFSLAAERQARYGKDGRTRR
ncbi:MAG: restriction endonuclease subunit S [Nitrospira sp.]